LLFGIVAVEDGIDVLHDVAADFEELTLVGDWYQIAFDPVVHGQLKWLG
jgi:hypothetical protein